MQVLGAPVDYLAAFAGGVLVSFTPCVYPLIPITASYIGANSAKSKAKGFFLSLVYVTGIAFTYSLLGLVASLTGTMFGRWSSSPLAYFISGAVFIIFGLSMADVFNLTFPSFIKPRGMKNTNYLSVFFLGLSSGLIVSPCLSPALGSILAYVASKKNLFYGATLLLCFAYGLGLVLVIAGTFSKWMVYIKRFCSLVLIGMGAYFVYEGIRRL
jgi:cytochrome c-type biogenesis protein